jgi:hypothetical protein
MAEQSKLITTSDKFRALKASHNEFMTAGGHVPPDTASEQIWDK